MSVAARRRIGLVLAAALAVSAGEPSADASGPKGASSKSAPRRGGGKRKPAPAKAPAAAPPTSASTESTAPGASAATDQAASASTAATTTAAGTTSTPAAGTTTGTTTTGTTTSSEASEASTVVIVAKGRAASIAPRIAADLTRTGLRVETSDHAPAAGATPVAVLTVERTRVGASLKVETPSLNRPPTQDTLRANGGRGPDDEVVATRGVELVRAAVDDAAAAAAEAKAASDAANAAAAAGTGAPEAPVEVAAEPPPPPPPPPPPAPSRPLFGFEAGGGVTYAPGDFGITPTVAIGGYASLSPRVDTGIFGFFSIGSAKTTANDTTLSLSNGGLAMSLRMFPFGRDRALAPSIAGVAGGVFVAANATVAPPFEARTVESLVPFAGARVGVGLRVVGPLRVRADVLVAGLFERPVLRVDDKDVAAWGPILVLPTAGLAADF